MPPPHSPGVPFIDEHLPLLLTRAAAAVSSGGDASPHRLDITAPAGRVLAALSDYPDTPVGRLATTCALQQPTVTKLLARYPPAGEIKDVLRALIAQGVRGPRR